MWYCTVKYGTLGRPDVTCTKDIMHYAILGPVEGKLVVFRTGEGSEGDAIG